MERCSWNTPGRFGCALIACSSASCGATPDDFHGAEPVAEVRQAVSVGEAVAEGCSTNTVSGLSRQIIDQMNCVIPGGALAEVPARPNFVKGGATLAWMQPPAVAALVAALDENTGMSLRANSMLRTVAQQYLLYRWYQGGQCNISLAAMPGSSNHESGLAVDVSEWESWQTLLEAHDFGWLGSNDPVHFDYEGSGVVDLSGKDVLAFQMLWNSNHPSDRIAEDGDYGPDTESRLEQSPTEGFATPPSCTGGAGGSGGSGGTAGGTAGTGGTGGTAGGAVVDAGGDGQSGTAGQSDAGARAGTGGSGASDASTPVPADDGDGASGCSCRTLPGRVERPKTALFALALAAGLLRRRQLSTRGEAAR